MIHRIKIPEEFGNCRLDDAVSQLVPGLSKTETRRIIDRGGCAVNDAMVRIASRKVAGGDLVNLGIMESGGFRELCLPEDSVLLENSDWICINKPSGVNSQRTPYQLKGTLEYWIGERLRSSSLQEPVRIPHRLDRGTSGVIIFPKNRPAAAWISQCFKEGTVSKLYLAIVDGTPEHSSWTCDEPIGKLGAGKYGIVKGGKPASTAFRVILSSGRFSLVEARPLTGRTHQIRVHLSAYGSPVTGDSVYGGTPAGRMMLHCRMMSFVFRMKEKIQVTAPLDELFSGFCQDNGLNCTI